MKRREISEKGDIYRYNLSIVGHERVRGVKSSKLHVTLES